MVNIRLLDNWSVLKQWLATGPVGGFNAIVTLALIGIGLELFGDSLPTVAKWIVFLIAAVVAITAYYVQYLRPLALVADRYERTLMIILLERLKETYSKQYQGEYEIRVNIMRVRPKWHRLGTHPLQTTMI